eukprot:6345152-Amphidinium_carterae.1
MVGKPSCRNGAKGLLVGISKMVPNDDSFGRYFGSKHFYGKTARTLDTPCRRSKAIHARNTLATGICLHLVRTIADAFAEAKVQALTNQVGLG